MNNKILFRSSLAEENELQYCQKYFDVIHNRAEIQKNDLIIPRYSALPYYDELSKDCEISGAKLIQPHSHHEWIADFRWYWESDLSYFTPKTWRLEDFRDAPEGRYVVKGLTNSKKFNWNTHMFAENKSAALDVVSKLSNDSLVGSQDLILREYIPLKTYEVGLNDLPFTAEWRFFLYKDSILTSGYYWSIAEDIDHPVPDNVDLFVQRMADIAKDHTTFYVLDVALMENEKPLLVEINCGTMSGLSMCKPDQLYSNLADILKNSPD